MFSIARSFTNVSYCALSFMRTTENVLKFTSPSFLSVREKHGLRKWIKVHDNNWVPRKRQFTDDKLTIENKHFLQEVIDAKFLKPGESPLKAQERNERAEWTTESRRCGVIARKIGIYPMWDKNGKRLLTTLLQVVDNHVIRYNPPEVYTQSRHRKDLQNPSKVYGSLVIGAESADPQLFTAAYNGLFTEAGTMPKRKLTRFRITPDAKIEPGTPLFANHFRVGDFVNVRGVTRYHGFQGVVKRYKFKGGPATRGCTKSHRRPGCIGGGRKRGVWKGKKMPGLMGGRTRMTVGLKVLRINTKHNVIYVQGPAVPGINRNYCMIYDCYAAKKHHMETNPPPFPTFYPEDADESVPENMYADEIHRFSEPSITAPNEEPEK